MDFNAGSLVGRRWAEPLAASGQLHGRHWAGSHGRRQAAFAQVRTSLSGPERVRTRADHKSGQTGRLLRLGFAHYLFQYVKWVD